MCKRDVIIRLICLFILGACGAPPPDATPTPTLINLMLITPTSPPPTPYMAVNARLLANAEQAEAPAIAWVDDALLVTWIGTDDLDVRHFGQWRFGDEWQPPQVLSLLTNHPYQQNLVVTSDKIIYLMWLDALPNFPEPQRVWYAPISENYTINPGALSLTTQEAWDYTAIGASNGGIWVVWQGGLRSEPTLYSQFIDSLGRPRFSNPIIENAHQPTLITDAKGLKWLFWLSDNQLWRGRFGDDGTLTDNLALTDSVMLGRGEFIEDFRVGIAGDVAFAFWQVNRRDGQVISYWAYGGLDGMNWTAPQPHNTTWFIPNQLSTTTMTAIGVAQSEPYDLRIYQWLGSYWWAESTGVRIPSQLLRPPTWLYRDTHDFILGWAQPRGEFADLWLWMGE